MTDLIGACMKFWSNLSHGKLSLVRVRHRAVSQWLRRVCDSHIKQIADSASVFQPMQRLPSDLEADCHFDTGKAQQWFFRSLLVSLSLNWLVETAVWSILLSLTHQQWLIAEDSEIGAFVVLVLSGGALIFRVLMPIFFEFGRLSTPRPDRFVNSQLKSD